LTWFILTVCGGNKNIDMSHLLYGIFQYFSTQNDVVYFSIFLGDTWTVREGAHATEHTQERKREITNRKRKEVT